MKYVDQLAGHITTFWTQYGQAVTLVGGLLLAVLVSVLAFVFYRTDRKYVWAEAVAYAAVLGWTSEGMWKVATETLQFPREIAVMTFCVAELLMFAAAGRAQWHNKKFDGPGPYGAIVWFFAASFGIAVAFNESTVVGFFLRILLPVAVTWLWWTGLTLGRKNAGKDTEEETQWAITPKSLLVKYGFLKPNKMTLTDAQIEFQTQRMVELADKAATTTDEKKQAKLLRKLRKLTRTASDDMVREVAERVTRAAQAAELMVPGIGPALTATAPAALPVTESADEEDGEPELEQLVEQFRAELERPVESEPVAAEVMPPAAPDSSVDALTSDGGVDHPTMEVRALPEPRPARTHSAVSGPVAGVVRAVASVPTGPTGRTLFYCALAEQLRQNDLRVLSGNSRTRNEAGYEAAASVDGELVNGTVRKYVKDFRQLLGLTGEEQGGEAHRAVALEQFPALEHSDAQ